MRIDVYGRFQLEVLREENSWVAYRVGTGSRVREETLVIPQSLAEAEIASYLDDLFHELGGPGQTIRVIS